MKSQKPHDSKFLWFLENIICGSAIACLFFGLMMIDTYIHTPLRLAGA